VTETFTFEGFDIPVDLAILTGGGPETWSDISSAHMEAYERYSPIRPGQSVLEIGCGVGRDAIPLSRVLGDGGSYVGVDVSGPSITWCAETITPRLANTRFDHLDILSPFYNPDGALRADQVTLPVPSGSVDRIILQSVFTHMFEPDIVHFLNEFRRVLRKDGLVFASFFVMDGRSLEIAAATPGAPSFINRHGDGCFIVDTGNPEGAVGYTHVALGRMLRASGFALDQPLHLGSWSGRRDVPDGQDIAILKPRRLPPVARRLAARLARRERDPVPPAENSARLG
jgi:SAM-dependent methyltransferase